MEVSSVTSQELAELREELQMLDQALIVLLSERAELSKQIATEKFLVGQEIVQPAIWEKGMQIRLQEAKEQGLDADFTQQLFELIHQYSVQIQQENS